ncbi:hypothetical protein TeGR_g10120 [Tetraparma gracilis]|uniref:Uncharacterized protein n=1 Tax=Tetraparma gracilis TaxID=2962635 RepID=A0ABQ6N850_9STRA|nr:hypothetical protein TeGR_g10120 [Tetraparma gracilis]
MSYLAFLLVALLAVLGSADVTPEERQDNNEQNEAYTSVIVACMLLAVAFAAAGISLRTYCTMKKGRTSRGIITTMMLPEDEVV